MIIKVAEYISEFLVTHGITDCFMVTGGGAMHLDDAIGMGRFYSYVYFDRAG